MTDTRGARTVRLIQDPAVSGNVLLVGVAIAAKIDFALDYGRSIYDLAALLWPDMKPKSRRYQIRETFERDMRTYRPPPLGRTCTAPMRRRDGLCGQPATNCGYLTDWATGEKKGYGGCSRHRAWADAARGANRAAKPENPPLPYANHGGALRVHFPEINWRRFWRELDPRWVEHPERTAWPKPILSLVLGGGGGGGDRPLLTAVGGGPFGPQPEEAP